MDEDNGKIIKFSPEGKPRIKNGVVLSFRVAKPGCDHHRELLVDMDARTLECADCGAIVDPWAFILEWADKDIKIFRRIGIYEKRLDEIGKELSELEKKKKGLESDIRRLDMKIAQRTKQGVYQ